MQRSGEDSSSAQGLIAGGPGATGLTCLVGATGLAALKRGSGPTEGLVWLPAKSGAIAGLDQISIEVTARGATCRVNGETVEQVAVAPGELDGPPGLYVAGGPVQISGFRVEQTVKTDKDGR